MMKTMLIPLAAIGIAISGCEGPDENRFTTTDFDQEARILAAEDNLDIQEKLKTIKEADPKIRDAYYAFDDQGNKVLHVVREEEDGMLSSNLFPAAMAGMLAAAIVSKGGFGTVARDSSIGPSQRFQKQDEKERRGSAMGFVAGGSSSSRAGVSGSSTQEGYRKAAAISLSKKAGVSMTSRSGAFTSGVSARAGGYSSGG